ncbi:hypothetical protein PoB_006302800 [Plakobranchus ocellatus]|uniref:Uncharacterized protein n=1 Tax=Plakobranchus ocellatus TaxID=259542 RepID=A0AAV4CXB3_9GAST|nr:hypothetical protein PoB_006302800 [Plakobranchus ocellatus]
MNELPGQALHLGKTIFFPDPCAFLLVRREFNYILVWLYSRASNIRSRPSRVNLVWTLQTPVQPGPLGSLRAPFSYLFSALGIGECKVY